MKKMKKFVALLLAVVMAMAMNITVFAAQEDLSDHTFTAYQIFTATSIDSEGHLGNLDWGTGITEEGKTAILTQYKAADVNALATTLSAMQKDSTEARAFAQLVYQYTQGDGIAVTSGTTKLDLGYYLIKDSTTTAQDAYNLAVLAVSDNSTAVVINNKTDVPSSDKVIVDNGKEVTANEASIGEEVNYKITGTLPSNLADYESYFVRFNDTMSKGLTYKADSLKVTIDGVDVTKYFYVGVGEYSATAGTKIEVSIADILLLSKLEGVSVDASDVITVTYTATLNDKAVIAGEGNPNDVTMDYSNNPDKSGYGTEKPSTPPENPPQPSTTNPVGTTPDKQVKTYTTEITITKVDESGKILTGAEFKLTGDGVKTIVVKTEDVFSIDDTNGTYWLLNDGTYTTDDPATEGMDTTKYANDGHKYALTTAATTSTLDGSKTDVKAFVGADGKVTFTGLGVGTYYIDETTTPTGYNTIKQVTFKVNFADEKFTVSDVTEGYTISDTNSVLSTTIENKKGTVLPSTGGIGTTIFYVAGMILVLGAGIILVAKRRIAR